MSTIKTPFIFTDDELALRRLADTASVMIWMADTKQQSTFFNSSWLEFTGRGLGQDLGTGWTELVHPEDYVRCLDTYNTAFDRRAPFKIQYRLRCADGKYHWIYESGTPRYSSTGEFIGYIGSCVDISDGKENGIALRLAQDELSKLQKDNDVEIALRSGTV